MILLFQGNIPLLNINIYLTSDIIYIFLSMSHYYSIYALVHNLIMFIMEINETL